MVVICSLFGSSHADEPEGDLLSNSPTIKCLLNEFKAQIIGKKVSRQWKPPPSRDEKPYTRFREAFDSGVISGENQFVSFENKPNSRIVARIREISIESTLGKTLIVESMNGQRYKLSLRLKANF
jgi:hypothetical protein